jgi:hypothetical protein
MFLVFFLLKNERDSSSTSEKKAKKNIILGNKDTMDSFMLPYVLLEKLDVSSRLIFFFLRCAAKSFS